jgi:hypothetical protein
VKGRRGDARNSADGAVRPFFRRRISQRTRRRPKKMVPRIPPTIAPTLGPFAALLLSAGKGLPVLYVPEPVVIPCVGSEPKGTPNWSVDEGRTEPPGPLSVGPSPLPGLRLSMVEDGASELVTGSTCVLVTVGGGEFVTGPSVCVAEFTTADLVGMEAGLEGGAGTGGWVVRVG